MKGKWQTAFIFLCIVWLSGCRLNFLSESTPTPPPGFTRVDDMVPDLFLRQPTFDAAGERLSVAGYSSPDSSTVAYLVVLNIVKETVIFRSPEGVWRWLSLSPDGKKIAVEQGGSMADPSPSGVLYVVDLVSDTASSHTRGSTPVWSPDGQELAFSYVPSRSEPLHLQILIRYLASGEETVVLDTQTNYGYITDMAWAPDKTKLAFAMHLTGGDDWTPVDLYVLDLQTGEWNQMTNGYYVASPNFSADGEKILFAGLANPTKPDYEPFSLYVVDLEGNCHRPDVSWQGIDIARVTLSPRGDKIALDTRQGVLVADTNDVLDRDFWDTGESCREVE